VLFSHRCGSESGLGSREVSGARPTVVTCRFHAQTKGPVRSLAMSGRVVSIGRRSLRRASCRSEIGCGTTCPICCGRCSRCPSSGLQNPSDLYAGRRRCRKTSQGKAEPRFIAECLDGRLTSLDRLAAKVPDAKAVVKARAEERGLLPDPVASALASYPHRPAERLVARETTPPGQEEIDLPARAVLAVLKDELIWRGCCVSGWPGTAVWLATASNLYRGREGTTMSTITLDVLLAASTAGGGSCLTSTTGLRPAGGEHASVAPAKFAPVRGKGSVYAYERRFLEGELRASVIIDSKQSQLNRAELGLAQAIADGHPVLERLPRIEVAYVQDGQEELYSDLLLSHRAFDGHFRAGTIDGVPAVEDPRYRALRDANPMNARALLEGSPVTLAYGGWDASRRARQGRWRSALVGEIIGFCADDAAERQAMKGGARVDPVGMQIRMNGRDLVEIVERQRSELSAKTADKIKKAAAKSEESVSASEVNLGGIPPTLNQLAGVACMPIVRTHVLSFAALRQMRFGAGEAGNAAARALLAALALNGLARSDAELYLRANCDLVEAGPTVVTLDQRAGRFTELEPLGIKAADELLAEALAYAEQAAGVRWTGQVLRVTGDPAIVAGSVDDEAEEE
jgi:CRISPR-associated protein Csb1